MKDYVWKPWKVGLVALAGLLLIGGGAIALFAGNGEATPETTRSESVGGAAAIPGAKGFSGGGGVSSPTAEPATETTESGIGDDVWSPALVRGGISFFAAFAVAFALRSFLKIFLIFAGIWAASLFFLSSLGWIEVHWSLIDQAFVGWTQTLGAQFKSATSFITGSLPSAGLAGLGLVAGLKKG